MTNSPLQLAFAIFSMV